jgi:hypothetical protein
VQKGVAPIPNYYVAGVEVGQEELEGEVRIVTRLLRMGMGCSDVGWSESKRDSVGSSLPLSLALSQKCNDRKGAEDEPSVTPPNAQMPGRQCFRSTPTGLRSDKNLRV